MNAHAELLRIVRLLKTELDWTLRVGAEPMDPTQESRRLVDPRPGHDDPRPNVDDRPELALDPDLALQPDGHRSDVDLATDVDAGSDAHAGTDVVARRPPSPPRSSRSPPLSRSGATRATDGAPPRTEALSTSDLAQLDRSMALEDVRAVLGDCTRCKLHALGRTKIVFGVGDPRAEVMFVGEGPGADEDRVGEPFVGAAGQLLTRIIEQGMGIDRKDVYIANIVKCRPPRNRDPEPDEVAACEPFLKAQIRQIRPKVLVALGRHAAQTLLRSSTPITRLRGQWFEYDGIPLMPTYHPAFLLRNPAEKRAVWSDIQLVLKQLGREPPVRG